VSEPVLYSFRRCPYAMRARLALLASGMTCEIREVKLSAKPPEMLAASPKGTVPVLVLADGKVIDESIDIMRWALAKNDPAGWLAHDDPALIAMFDGPFKQHLDRYKYPSRHQSDPAEHRAAGLALLEKLESRLQSHANLCGEAMGLADAATFPFVRQFSGVEQAWFDGLALPAVQLWLARHLGSPLFAAAMQRLEPWKACDAPVRFPALPFPAPSV
jgi:glutathione S-transferase